MANARNDGMVPPEDESGNEHELEQQTEEDRRRRRMLQDGLAGGLVGVDQEPLREPTRPEPPAAPTQVKSDVLPSNWQDILAERLSKFNDDQRIEYDRQIYNRIGSNHTVTPNYQLELSAIITKRHGKPGYGRDVNDVNRDEDMRAYWSGEQERKKAHVQHPRPVEKSSAPPATAARPESAQAPAERKASTAAPSPASPQNSPPTAKRIAPHHRPPPRKAAPDRTGRVSKRFNRMIRQHAEVREEKNLPLSRVAQDEFARIAYHQEAERKALADQQRQDLQLLNFQHNLERVGAAATWLARDLKERESPDAAKFQKEADEVLRAASETHNRRQNLAVSRVDPQGWDRAASLSTSAPPSQAKEAPANQANAAPLPFRPTQAPSDGKDPNIYFQDASGKVLTEDRVRGMLHRYEDIRELHHMPSGMNEENERLRMDTLQATVRDGLVTEHENKTLTLKFKHLAERAGTSSEWLSRDTGGSRDEARRAFAAARLAMGRYDAIDPRDRNAREPGRAEAEQQTRQQTIALRAAQGDRSLSAEERATLQASGKSVRRDRDGEGGARSIGPTKPGRGPQSGGTQNSRGSGGRGR